MTENQQALRRPVPRAEPPEPSPGGPDAVPGVGGDGVFSNVPRDPDPDLNPETGELPAETRQREDTDTEATKGGEEKQAESEPA